MKETKEALCVRRKWEGALYEQEWKVPCAQRRWQHLARVNVLSAEGNDGQNQAAEKKGSAIARKKGKVQVLIVSAVRVVGTG
jgi:hypothetical protein